MVNVDPLALGLNPGWHGLREGKLPPFPESAVREVLTQFGIVDPIDLQPWPFGPFDVPAAFWHEGARYLLKGRHPERGVEALHQTHEIQRQLSHAGVPVARLLTAPGGETLLEGPGYAGRARLFYEIQEFLPGKPLGPDPIELGLAGEILADFHERGDCVQSGLVSKFVDTERWFVRPLEKYLKDASTLGTEEFRIAREAIDRFCDMSFQHSLAQTLTHGDFCPNNVLISGREAFIIDLDEVGRGNPAIDLAIFLICVFVSDGKTRDTAGRFFLEGYERRCGPLSEPQRLAVRDQLVALTARDSLPWPFSEVCRKMDTLGL